MSPQQDADISPSETSKNHDSMDNTSKMTHSVTFHDASDVESNDRTLHGIGTTNTEPLFLRWSRLGKTVTIKEHNVGLLRGSIAAPTAQSDTTGFRKQGTTQKVILDSVSGCAAPGEVLAMMG
jgi:hypothetical protein